MYWSFIINAYLPSTVSALNSSNDITLGKLSYGHARALVSLEGEKLETAYKIINEKSDANT